MENKTSKARSFVCSGNKASKKRNIFLCLIQIYINIRFPPISCDFLFLFSTCQNFKFWWKTKLQRLVVPPIFKIKHQLSELFFWSHPTPHKFYIFRQFFLNFDFFLQLSQNFNFLRKYKTWKSHSLSSSQNKASTKRSIFLCSVQIFPNIVFSTNFL